MVNVDAHNKFQDLINTLLGVDESKTALMDFCIVAYIDRDVDRMTYHLINTILLSKK